MTVTLFAFTAAGRLLKDRLAGLLENRGHRILAEPPEVSLAERAGEAFRSGDALVFIGAAGIAVRAIAPFLRSKAEDPAVAVIDEKGRWAVSLLSGHLGGANALAMEIAELLGAQPVITTATDINGVFAADLWAKANGLVIGGMEEARDISMRLLEGEEVLLLSDFPIAGKNPRGIRVIGAGAEEAEEAGIRVSIYRDGGNSLRLIPRCVYLGVGCRSGVSREAVYHAITEALSREAIDIRGVAALATIDIKKEEPALTEICRQKEWPLLCYTAEELKAAGNGFTSSAFVFSAVGVDNVCERAAFLASQSGDMLARKFAAGGVTVAAALGKISLSFETRENGNE
ncbi:MAG: cobalamin biosynthesis protein [Spirochaetaceae bacterium]|jgi:cobalt-precorrin 5A hydrolase|nr:cobalamin biosynthesis protein [Spirochaetaceae bacterium]